MRTFRLDEFDDLMGVPWQTRGRDPIKGLDCYGLIMEVYRRLGLHLPDYLYPDDTCAQGALIAEKIHIFFERVPCPEPGDLIRLWYRDPVANHIGVFLGGENLVPGGLVLHMAHYGALKTPLAKLRKAGRVAGIYRAKG